MQVMQYITAAVLAAFVSYIGAWYMGAIEGNFALLLLLATVVTGVYWLAERFVFLPRRRAAAEQAAAEKQRLTARAAQIRATAVAAEREKARREVHEHALDHLTDSDVNKLFDRIISHYDEDSHR